MSERIEDVIRPRPLDHALEDYWRAPGGTGPLAAQWADKPHRLLYDLLAALMMRTSGTEPTCQETVGSVPDGQREGSGALK